MARKPKKWSNMEGVVPAVPQDTLSPWFQKVLKEKDTLADLSLLELDARYAVLVAEEKAEEEARRLRNIKYKALEMRMLEELEKVATVSGQETWRGNGTTLSPKRSLRPTVKDKAKLKEWLGERDMEDLLELPSGRLNSIVADAFDAENASMLTPAQRATLTAGLPGSQLAPPGVEVFMEKTINRTARGTVRPSGEE